MMREAFVGFDSAWVDKSPGAVTQAIFENGRLSEFTKPAPARFGDAAEIVEARRTECDFVLVTIDQPTVVPNDKGSRPVDGVAASLVSKLRGGVQPANRGKEEMFGPSAPIWRFLRRLGAAQDPPAARESKHGLHVLEVFPALALPALEPRILGRMEAARYNPANKGKFTLDDWRMVADCVAGHADSLGLAPLARWASQQVDLSKPTKGDQDCLDAAICLVVALQWRRAPRRQVAVIGDGESGYMVTPVSPDTREILERAAMERGVPFDTDWQ